MAYAIVSNVERVEPDGGNAFVVYNIAFGGTGVADIDLSTVRVGLAPGDTPVQLRDKISTAVLAKATGLGYPLRATDVTLPAFQKGV